MSLTWFSTLGLALTTLVPAGAQARPGGSSGIEVGAVATYTFRAAPYNSLGIQRLEDLRGKPVLVDFWGTRCPPCVGAAVPASIKLQETYGDDLQVIFVEAQGASLDQTVAFALSQKWLGGRAMWTKERPFESGSNLLPACVLIGNDGRVLLKGNPIPLQKEIERQIAEQIKLAQSPPPATPACVQSAWAEFARGQYARGVHLARGAEGSTAGDAAALTAIRATLEQFQARLEARFTRAGWLVENGFFDEAVELLDDLDRGTQDDPDLARRVASLVARSNSKDLSLERTAARDWTRLQARLFEAPAAPDLLLELDRFVEQRAGTKAAARALELGRFARLARTGR